MIIKSYNDFTSALLKTGFSLGGGNSEGIFSVVPWGWDGQPPYETPVRWHSGDPETDPWEWRMRVLDERDDIAYAKVFFKKSGFITKEWYPYFLAARRSGKGFAADYSDGAASQYAKRIYDCVSEAVFIPLHELKQLSGFSKEDKSKFERALIELQMKMYITMCGRQQKLSKKGEEYGWSSTVFCTTEQFFGSEVFEAAAEISKEAAEEKITAQVLKLNPAAQIKKIKKFINI